MMTQPTMEGINPATPNSGAPLDLRTPESEAAKADAANTKAALLAEQTNASASSPAGMDGVTPAPSSTSPTPQPDVETTQTSVEPKTSAFALPPEPSKPAEDLPVANPAVLGSSPIGTTEAPQVAPLADQATKKPGFFGKLFGKK